MRHHWVKVILPVIILAFLAAPQMHSPCSPCPAGWRSGDVVLVNGVSWRSKVVRLWQSSSGDFTHCGVVCVRDGVVFIVHADPTAGNNGVGKVIAERWDVALGAGRVLGGAVYRLREESHAVGNIVRSSAELYAAAGVPFDHSFDLKTADQVYCTELVWRVYEKAGIDLRPKELGEYFLPADLLRDGKFREVSRF